MTSETAAELDLYQEVVMDHKRARYTAAEESIRAEVALFLGWLKRHPDDPALRFEAADSISWMGSLALAQGKLADAESHFARQVEMLRANMAAEPDNTHWKVYSVFALNLLTDVQKLRGRTINLNTLASFNNDPDFLLGFYTGGTGEAVFHFKDETYDALYAAQRAATALE